MEFKVPKPVTAVQCTVKKENATFSIKAERCKSKAVRSKKKDFCVFAPGNDDSKPRVQIKAGKQDVMRRISAFQAWKREEINDNNIKEFCIDSHRNQKNWVSGGCARVDSNIIKRPDCKSHIKVHRVVNEWGPQTCGIDPGTTPLSSLISDSFINNPITTLQKKKDSTNSCTTCGSVATQICPTPITDRLATVEYYLGVNTPIPTDIYCRIKQIEDRILRLEAVSPEYAADTTNYSIKPEKDTEEEILSGSKKGYSKNDLGVRLTSLKSDKMPVKRKKMGVNKKKKMPETKVKIESKKSKKKKVIHIKSN